MKVISNLYTLLTQWYCFLMSEVYKNFQKQFAEGKIGINTTTFILVRPLFTVAYKEFKHLVKKKFLENKEKFIIRACLENETALDICWKWQLIGLRPSDEETPYLSKQYKDWRVLINK